MRKQLQVFLGVMLLRFCCLCLLLSQAHSSLASPQRRLQQYFNYDNDYIERNANIENGDALFLVGNSYIERNNLTDIIMNMLEHSSDPSSSGVKLPLQTETWCLGGAKWKHYAFQLSSQDHLPPSEKFEDALRRINFRWVVLQEQSEVPGLFQSGYYQNEWDDSIEALQTLDTLIQQFGNSERTTQTILFQTWGRLHHDDDSPELADIYDTFPHHQYRIASGYQQYQKLISTSDRPVLIAPVGYAFEYVYNGMVEDGLDPEQKGGRFANLYDEDGSHPSEQGSYLAASVLVGSLTGQDPRQFDWDYALIDIQVQQDLREVAYATIAKFCDTCNPIPNKATYDGPEERVAVEPTSESSSSSFHLMRFLFLVGVGSLVWKKCNGDRSGNGGYAPLPQDRANSGLELM